MIRKATTRPQSPSAVGERFQLSFTDAISGKTISMKDLKGKVVVIDFWATWCPQCVAAMPHLKELYAQYKGKGVEFIGVNLDEPQSEGGLAAMKQFVDKEGIKWPQYYQGGGIDVGFAAAWGIEKTPTVFIIDSAGNLKSTDAGENLDRLLVELTTK